ncbi:MAG TPA: hypothetical protein VGG62_12245 [Terracidiphilus sp.]|jgi:hypothetical protein
MSLLDLGQIVMTDGVVDLVARERTESFELSLLLRRHMKGDWGELDEHDQGVNRSNMERGWRILSQYTLNAGQKIWIITERGITTVLLPEEY